jgi:hypothetical protein
LVNPVRESRGIRRRRFRSCTVFGGCGAARPASRRRSHEARKGIEFLEQEVEVMRRAVAYLSQDVNPTDITDHATAEGKFYLCAVKDLHLNRIVCHSIDGRM